MASHPDESRPVIRIALATPAGAIRAGLRSLLSADESMSVAAESASIGGLPELPLPVDVLILTPGAARDVDWATLLARFPAAGLLFLTSETGEPLPPLTGLGTHPWGLLPLDADGGAILAAVRALFEGLITGTPAMVREWLLGGQNGTYPEEPDAEPLTPRETEVLQQLAIGLTNKQIGLALHISEHTVKFHISAIYAKLRVLNRADAVRVGVRRGLIVI
jgi:DNA-binding NarL/FixJ family response regulator